MKPYLKSVLILFSVVFAFGAFQIEEASAQGPFIRRMREKLNNGKPLLPFIPDSESAKPDLPRKAPTPASKKPTPASKKLTPASRKTPTPAKRPTPADKTKEKFPSIKLESGSSRGAAPAATGRSKEFGMAIAKSGESFVVSQIDPRGNAAAAGVKRGDEVLSIGGAEFMVIEEYDAIADAMSGGDRVEFEIARRGSKPQKVFVQYGQPEEIDDEEAASKFDVAPSLDLTPTPTKRNFSDRYEPSSTGSGLRSIYEVTEKPSSILTPSPTPNRVESLEELDYPALEGGK